MAYTQQRLAISDDLAQRLLVGARDAARATGGLYSIAVVDDSGSLTAFLRMDGAKLNSAQIAQDKAYTAATSQMTTEKWSEVITADDVIGRGAPTAIDRLVLMGGGIPVVVDGTQVGAIGVSGGHWTDDKKVAEEALAAVGLSA